MRQRNSKNKYFAIILMLAMLCACDSEVGQIDSEAARIDPDSSELFKDIDSIVDDLLSKDRLSKDELETTTEFNERVKKHKEKYSGKTYKVELKVTNLLRPGTLEHNIHTSLKYNADTSVLTFLLPSMEIDYLYSNKDGESKSVSLPYTFIQTEPTVKDKHSRQLEALGTTRSNYGAAHYGIAVLGEGLHSFRVDIARDAVKDIYDNGTIVFNVKSDLLYLTEHSTETITQLKLRYAPIILFTNQETNQVGCLVEEFMLPVHVISVELYNNKGNLVLKEHLTNSELY